MPAQGAEPCGPPFGADVLEGRLRPAGSFAENVSPESAERTDVFREIVDGEVGTGGDGGIERAGSNGRDQPVELPFHRLEPVGVVHGQDPSGRVRMPASARKRLAVRPAEVAPRGPRARDLRGRQIGP